jgi:hypothetical protein
VTAEPPEAPERRRRSEGGKARRLQIRHVALGAGIIAALAVGGYLWLSGDDSPGETADAPEAVVAQQGVACPHLHEAFTHRQAGDAEALRRSVDAAARASEHALQQSGQEFGRPEELALELQHALAARPGATEDLTRFLAEARETCERIGQW